MKKMILLMLVLIMAGCAARARQSYNPTTEYVLNESAMGCLNYGTTEKLTRLAASGDNEAFKKMSLTYEQAGECSFFLPGESVYFSQVNWSNLKKIRRKGSPVEYWTP
jgi:PBP1b-binding outer membrane lipoprotein LpoB